MFIVLDYPKGLDLGVKEGFGVISFNLLVKKPKNLCNSFGKRFYRTIRCSDNKSEFDGILMQFWSPINMW